VSQRREPPPGPFRFEIPLEVRFRDTDAMGHVNNAVYQTYFEAARAAYYRAVTGRPFETPAEAAVSLILAHASIEYRAPAFFGETLLVACRAAWLSRSSFGLEYRIRAADDSPRGAGRLIADGETVQVTYDYAAGRPVRLPETLRTSLEAFEGHAIPAPGG
jgi:acyl-CoA thioester hydrolase